MTSIKVKELVAYFNQFERFSIAVSGGIDSMLLAYIANRFSKAKVKTVHAFSPAVPEAALERVKEHAKRYQWDLQIINAREFDDPNYINNPVNRCYFCKSNLYTRISEHSQGVVFSGTNLDDLADYRPGLEAAKEQNVKHPYVQVGIDKTTIYAIAKHYGLNQLHVLPAQPCLASRVETGIKINADDLGFINQMEEKTRQLLPEMKNIRCRITHQGTFLEIDVLPENTLFRGLSNTLSSLCEQEGRIFSGIRTYQKGSAFINGVAHG
ncbi:hypothetical protein [uncultured Paraglaciecola sp.]|uniref:hypothetical protein n=1 Tax=uncultured Paraglaciecola sp. TaxID=1765024 RepID=UPI0030DD46BC|tara:strand:- start:66688 stop:67488 length:801 start_codon:yes stop_codon:yes gene_type:complete